MLSLLCDGARRARNVVHRTRVTRALVFGCALLLASLAASAHAADAPRLPNLIFIMADDLGYGDLGCYGQATLKTPNIDRLSQEGMRFTQMYAGSTVCAPSRCVLMTGKHLGHALIRGNGKDNLRPEDVTVAEVFKSAGYRTGMFGKWGLGHEGSSGLPTRQGFESFFGYLDQHHAHNYYPTFLIRNGQRVSLDNVVPGEGTWGQGVATERREYSHDLIMAEALKFIDAAHADPFFLYLPITLPHANNEARNKGMEIPDLGTFASKDWPEPQKGTAAMIAKMDHDVGRLLARLEKFGIDEQTLVIFTSDNGPHAEGGNDPTFFDSNGPLRGIKRALYEGGIRVPFLARWPGRVAAGATNDHIGYFGDLMATAADLSGGDAPEGLDSISFLPTLLGQPDQQQHDFLYWEFYEQGSRQAVRMGDWKAIRQPMLTGKVELYNLANDLGEEHDVAAQHAEVVGKLVAAMERAHVPNARWQVPVPRGKPKKTN
ncbi:MAG: arylsulfatase [Planctomycetales bacterium]|nr:arylsulfatase [Planctomycetales bacterium]